MTGRVLLMTGLTISALGASARPAVAQSGGGVWNDPRSRALVELATKRRAEQLADTGLVDYRATAQGYVNFLAQLGEGFLAKPKLVKTDQLALEVYWRAPNLSKQRIIGRRDTLMLPTDIQYHRDHLGIVQNNFPDFIRLGDGDEVRDVPHPLSAAGLREYDFQIGDSIRINAGGRTLDMLEVKVRPKDDLDPRVVGAVYLDPAEGQVVRMAFNFTHAAFLDPQLEDLAIVLENRLVAGRFWLPSRQEIEIRRRGTYMDFPVRGIIRGYWLIGEYSINVATPAQTFVGPEIVLAPAAERARYVWPGSIMESLPPDVLATVDPDIQRVQEEARVLVRAQALTRVQRLRVSAPHVSDFVRINRVEGPAFGVGFATRLFSSVSLRGRFRYGTEDHVGKAGGSLRWERPDGSLAEAFASRDFADIGDRPESSTLMNSIGAQEFGRDLTDPFGLTTYGARFVRRLGGSDVGFAGAFERHTQLSVHSQPSTGTYLQTPQITAFEGVRGTLRFTRPVSEWVGPGALSADARLSALVASGPDTPAGTARQLRGSLLAEHRSTKGGWTFVVSEHLAGVLGERPPLQELVYFGGPISLPGYIQRDVAGTWGSATRLEMQVPVPFVPLPLGRFGKIPAQARLAPFVAGAVVGGKVDCVTALHRCPGLTRGFYPAAGIGLITIFDMVRFDVARGLGRRGDWTFTFDVNRDFWPIL